MVVAFPAAKLRVWFELINLIEKDMASVKEQLTQSLFEHIPVGVGSKE